MKISKFAIQGPLLLTPLKFNDDRGFVSETYSARRLESHIGAVNFVQENHTSTEAVGTIRGLHFQIPPAAQGKLVRVARGAVYDVAVDIRTGSPTFGGHIGVELSAANWAQLWIPAGFAHGFCTLEPGTEVIYKLTDYFSPAHDCGLAWNDATVRVDWPVDIDSAKLSVRDCSQPQLAELPQYFTFGL